MQWFLHNGGVINGIEVAKFPAMGRGFAANRNLLENEKILQIPSKLIFSTKNMPNYLDDRTRKVLDTLGSDAALYAWLLLERHKPDSFFKPYLDILPAYVPSLVYFNQTELQELQSSTLINEVLEMQSSARADYRAFLGAYNKVMSRRADTSVPVEEVSYDEYLWAMSMFNSRGLRFQGPVYMAPMADIFNFQPHPAARPANNGDFFAKHHKLDASGISVFSDRAHKLSDPTNIAGGQQVFEDYGDNSDEIYFKYHGFVADENPFRCAILGLDAIGTDLVGLLPSGANSLASTGQSAGGLLPGISATHRALVDALEFQRLPSKCVDRVVDPTAENSLVANSATATTGGYFGKGLEVMLILLSFTEKEASHCMHYISTSTSNSASHGKNKAAAKNWPGIFKECKFSAAEEFLRSVRSTKPTAKTNVLESQAPGTLNHRVLTTIHRFLELNLERDNVTSSIADDSLILSDLQSQLSVPASDSSTDSATQKALLHKYLAVKYRFHRKKLLLNVAERYGASSVATKLTTSHGLAMSATRVGGENSEDPDSPAWMSEDFSDSSLSALSAALMDNKGRRLEVNGVAADDASAEDLLRTPLSMDAPLSEKIRVFNAWFHSLSPAPCHIAAKEIPEFRMGTITTKSIEKGEIYLGISTTHGGIMDSEVAQNGPNKDVSGLIARIVAQYPKRDDFHELLFFLLHERFVRKEQSFYWPYLSLLPTYEDMENNAFVPLLWGEEDVKTRLGPSDVAGLIGDYHIKTRNRYNSLVKMPLIKEFFPDVPGADERNVGIFSFRNYQWATVILDSRAIWWAGKRHLVPMLDFVNCQEHSIDKSLLHSTVLDPSGKYAITKAAREFQAGEQLFENYGQPNHIYFTYHGFLLQNNSHDCVHLEMPLTSSDLAAINVQKAAPVLQKLRLSPSKPSLLPVCLTHPVAPMVWAFLAVKTNTFESLHEKQLLGKANVPGADALLSMLDERLAQYSAFQPSGHRAAEQLLAAEVQHLLMVRGKVAQDRALQAAQEDYDEL